MLKKSNLVKEEKGKNIQKDGPFRESNPGPLASKARLIPLDQTTCLTKLPRILRTFIFSQNSFHCEYDDSP